MDSTYFHTGLWLPPEKLPRTLLFFETILNYEIISRTPRKTGGERLFLRNKSSQFLELLISEDVTPQPKFGLHPEERVCGVPHLCFIVEDLSEMKTILQEHGFKILREVPAGLSGYVQSETGEHRILFVEGPGHVSIEIFEFKQQAPMLA